MFRLPLYSLRAKLLLFSVALVAIPGIIFGVIAFVSSRQALQGAVGQQLTELAQDTATNVATLLARETNAMHTWARRDVMRDVVAGDPEERISQFLSSLKAYGANYIDLLCTDAHGRVVAASNPALLGASHAERAWFRTIVSGRDFVGHPIQSPEHGRSALEFAVPVYDPASPGVVIGALLGLYDWDRAGLLNRIQLSSAALKFSVAVLILDGSGTVIAEARGADLPELRWQNLRSNSWLAARRRLPQRHPGYLVDASPGALVGYARLTGMRRDWTALAVQPMHEALAPAYHEQARLVLLLLTVLLTAVVVAMILAERMSRPLRELISAAREIGRAGSTQTTVPVRSRDEIGQLAEAFNDMSSELKRAQNELVTAAKFAFVGELAAGVAHEVRTPLGILRSSAQILARSLNGNRPESGELIEMIIGEVDRLERVVAELLQLARPHEPMVEPTPLAPILARAADFIDAQAAQKGITIRREFASEQPPAQCDSDQIYQVTLNLIVNALQVLSPGGEVTVRTLPAHNGSTSFEVCDNGPGMPAEVLGQIFTPFFTMRAGGTGLGLALVHRIVQAHGGMVSVDSVVGHGTTFRVALPSAEEAS